MDEYYFPSTYHNGLYTGSCDITPDSWTLADTTRFIDVNFDWDEMATLDSRTPEPQQGKYGIKTINYFFLGWKISTEHTFWY